ncbi:hypothetical protein ACHHYP_05317, partial [Achlya hypogyna]
MDFTDTSPDEWVARIAGMLLLVALSALFSGLTLGLMSLDKIGLEVVIGAGEDAAATEQEKKLADAAKKIAPIRKDGNLLLTTLLLGNVAVNSLLSILMADLTSGMLGFVVSTAVIVLFGEVIPQAACSRHALVIGAKSVPIVKCIIVLFYVFAKPVSLLLDAFLGQDVGTIFTKKELWKMLDIHVKQEMIDDEESWIMYGALHYKSQTVAAILTPMRDVYMLPATAKLSRDTVREIYSKGFSRIPVYATSRNNVIGLLFTKDLVFIDPDEAISVQHFVHIFGRGVHRVWPDTNLGDLLKAFKMGHSRLALVQDVNNKGDGDPFLEAIGVVSLEDVIEEILQDTFRTEGDVTGRCSIIAQQCHGCAIGGRRKQTAVRHVDHSAMRFLGVASDDDDMYLTTEEARDLAVHLVAHQPVFQMRKTGGKSFFPLVAYGRETPNGPRIYSQAHVANHCVIVMEGSVKVTTGRFGLVSERGVWSVLGAESLVVPANTHVPDFSAFVSNKFGKILCVQISHVDFQQMLHPISLCRTKPQRSATVSERSPPKRFDVPKLAHSLSDHVRPAAERDEAKERLLFDDRSGSSLGEDSSSNWGALEWTLRISAVVILTVLAALFSGLTLGYMSLDKNGLQIIIDAGEDPNATDEEKKNAEYARKIKPLRSDGHLLLTTLLYGNVSINSIMAIAMADMTTGLIGFFVTTVILVIFGELIPQALCSRHALAIGGRSVPIVKFFLFAFYVAAKPVAMVLDFFLGYEIGATFTKLELTKMLEIHVKQQMLDADETDIMKGALYFKRKPVASVMTPIEN